MSVDLLPPNATELEQDLVKTADVDTRLLTDAADKIANVKFTNTPVSFLPWLIDEYHLGELSAWIPDPRQAISEGIEWNRIRGTKQSLLTAFSWVDFIPSTIDEGVHGNFADIQIDTGSLPDSELIVNIAQLAKLSLPARSRLRRLYHERDYAPMQLNVTKLNESILSNFSGIYHEGTGVWMSFVSTTGIELEPELVLSLSSGTAMNIGCELTVCNSPPCALPEISSGSHDLDGINVTYPDRTWTDVIGPDNIVSEIGIILGSN